MRPDLVAVPDPPPTSESSDSNTSNTASNMGTLYHHRDRDHGLSMLKDSKCTFTSHLHRDRQQSPPIPSVPGHSMAPLAEFPSSFVAPVVVSKKTITKKAKIHSELNVTVNLHYSPAAGPAHPARLTLVTDRPCFPTLGNARLLEVDRPKLFSYYMGTTPPTDPQPNLPVVWITVKAPANLSVMVAFPHGHDPLRDRFNRLLTDFFNSKDLRLSAGSASSASAAAAGLPALVPVSPSQPRQFAYKDSPSATAAAAELPPQRTRTRSAHSAEVALAAFHSSSSSPSRPATAATAASAYLANPLKRPASPTRNAPPDLHDPIGGTTHPTASKRSRPNDDIPMGPPRPPPPPSPPLPLSSLPTLANGTSITTAYPLSPTPTSAAASLRSLGLTKPMSGAMGAMQQFQHQASSIRQVPTTRRVAQGLTRPAPYSSPMLSVPLAIPPSDPPAPGSSAYFEASRSRTGRGTADMIRQQPPQHPIAGRGRRGKRNGRGGRVNGFVNEFGDGPMDRASGGMAAGVVAELSGMRNNGNTCYQNALLVAFLATSPFMSIISRLAPIDQPLPPDLEGPFVSDLGGGTRSRPRSASVPPRSPSPSKDLADSPMDTRSEGGRDEAASKSPPKHELVKAIAAIAWKRERNPGQVIDPRPFTEGLLNLSGLFKRGEQADAQELLTECLAIMESESPPIGPSAVNLFQFTLVKRVQCDNCPYHSTMTEPHRGLSLEVPPATSLAAPPTTSVLLQQYFAAERIEYKCERCKHPTASVKHFVHRPPQVLVLHLKRFQMMPTGQVRKKHEPVAIQEVVDLAPFAVPTGGELSSQSQDSSSSLTVAPAVPHPPPTPQPAHSTASSSAGPPATPTIVATAASPTSTPLSFKLTAIVNHLGHHARRGHYVCDMRDPSRPEHWLTFDDSHVSRLGPMVHLTQRRGQHGYLLFYVAEGPTPPPPSLASVGQSPQVAQLRPVIEIPPMPARTPSPSANARDREAAGRASAALLQQPDVADVGDHSLITPAMSTRSRSPLKSHIGLGERVVGSPTSEGAIGR